ncbi:hypothetical protein MLD38_019320 [Melastoma candidum]|uniref:Uncharacterized protein n=1 Tax=Melastoma candidum TaxID=119954 RepID=A0ACB9R060_9MYRT|nr:hypothetical protein MLD38_019320 [Melastoma candidum]
MLLSNTVRNVCGNKMLRSHTIGRYVGTRCCYTIILESYARIEEHKLKDAASSAISECTQVWQMRANPHRCRSSIPGSPLLFVQICLESLMFLADSDGRRECLSIERSCH